MAFKRKTQEEKEKEIKELTTKMENKISNYFESEENIKEHLAFMSKFYNYSPRNMALIDSQFRGAEAVGSFNHWKEKGASVNKGEKGIKILVPTPVEYFKRADNWVQVKYANAKEKEQLKKGQLEKQKKLFFKVGHVFEYTQTNAREKGIPISEIFGRYHRDGTIDNDKEFIKALENVSDKIGVKIATEPPIEIGELGTAKGAYSRDLNMIVLNPRNTPMEDITVLMHELAHAELHNNERNKARNTELTTNEKEFQAEMTAYVVASRYNIPTENFSLSYLAGWTKNKEFADKEQLLREVRETSASFINVIDEHFEKVNLLEKEHINYRDELMNIQGNNGLNSDKLELENTEFWRKLEERNPEDHNKYLTNLPLYLYEQKHGEVKFDEPMMYIHGVSREFEPFGEINNRDLDPHKYADVIYTVVIPEDDKLNTFSNKYESNNFVHPLHHIEKNELVDKETYSKLEKSWHNVLEKEDNEYINSIAPSIVASVYALEKNSPPLEKLTQPEKQQPKKVSNKINQFDLER
ncbi:MAG: ImmA/IrrE family metallo-endopeptidase [Bacillaceae bacterium]